MIPDEIGGTLFIVALISAVIVFGRLIWRCIAKRRAPEPVEPEALGDTCGWAGDGLQRSDSGGLVTPAPEIGSGVLAGGGEDDWPDGPKGLSAYGYQRGGRAGE